MGLVHALAGIVAGLLGPFVPGVAADYYEATFEGTITHVQFGGADPGDFAGVAVGQHYTYIVRTELTGVANFDYSLTYALISSSLVFDDGSPMGIDVPMAGSGALEIFAVPFAGYGYTLGAYDTAGSGPYRASPYLWDPDEPFARSDTDLPLSLDLGAFGSRTFGVGGDPNAEDKIGGTIDGFSARIVPGPGAAGILVCGGGWVVRRRRGALTLHT